MRPALAGTPAAEGRRVVADLPRRRRQRAWVQSRPPQGFPSDLFVREAGERPMIQSPRAKPVSSPGGPPPSGRGRDDREVRRRQGNTLAGPGNLPPGSGFGPARLGKADARPRGSPPDPRRGGRSLRAAPPGHWRARRPSPLTGRSPSGSAESALMALSGGAPSAQPPRPEAGSPRPRGLWTRGRRGLRLPARPPPPAASASVPAPSPPRSRSGSLPFPPPATRFCVESGSCLIVRLLPLHPSAA